MCSVFPCPFFFFDERLSSLCPSKRIRGRPRVSPFIASLQLRQIQVHHVILSKLLFILLTLFRPFLAQFLGNSTNSTIVTRESTRVWCGTCARVTAIDCRRLPHISHTVAFGLNQFAYTKGRGARDALGYLTMSWILALNRRKKVAVYCSECFRRF